MGTILAVWLLAAQGSIETRIQQSNLAVLVQEYVTSFCALAGPQAPDAYDLWVDYVADHIRRGVGFGPDYDAVAERARAQIYNIQFDCVKHIHDPDQLELRAEETPAAVGRELWKMFAGADASQRARAADAVLKFAYPSK